MNRTLTLSGMHCQNCVKRLTEAFTKVPAVMSAHVTLHPPEAHLTTMTDVPLSALQDAACGAGAYSVTEAASPAPSAAAASTHSPESGTDVKKPSLYPLILIVSYITATVALAAWGARGAWDWRTLMLDFMAGFFLVFSFFKLLDIRGFADAYQSYDIVARRSRPYALAYPFIELALSIAYLVRWQLPLVSALTLVLMLIGSVGVLRAVLDRRAIRCACLGTALNLPMTTVTLVEDLGMAVMAGAALLWPH